MKKLLINIGLIVITLCLNFGIFILSYKKLAFPYLHEVQRVENAPYIFSYVLIGFLLSAIISVLVIHLINKKYAQ